MATATYRELVIDWVKESDIDKVDKGKYNTNSVLYCVYCNSHIYGRDVLAYIGKTENFNIRRIQHEKSFFQFVEDFRFVIGYFKNDEVVELEVPESILIANHKPFYNKEYLHDIDYRAKEEKIIIINNNKLGSLKNVVTNYWWLSDTKFSQDAVDAENNGIESQKK